jgi:hypothetical protein
MKALVNTKSNFKNLNGTWVNIRKFLGNFAECEYFCIYLNRMTTFDLLLTEIKEIKH